MRKTVEKMTIKTIVCQIKFGFCSVFGGGQTPNFCGESIPASAGVVWGVKHEGAHTREYTREYKQVHRMVKKSRNIFFILCQNGV